MLEILDEPTENGLYVAYVNDELTTIRAKRIFLMYYDGWFYPMSDQKYRNHVYGCIGPLPIMPLTD